MARRVLIMGNSGSGKSTLARQLQAAFGLRALDLDQIVWVPGEIAQPRPRAEIEQDLQQFVAAEPQWVIEGCYGEWIAHLAATATHLVFLNPGIDACLANNRRRPHEPHKYATPEAQEAMFQALQDWVRAYETRDDAWSLAGHRRVFDAFEARKWEVTDGQLAAVLGELGTS